MQKRAQQNIHEYLLPFKPDVTDLPEISPSIKYLSFQDCNSEELANIIYDKIKEHRERDTFITRIWGTLRYFFYRKSNSTIAAILVLCGIYLLLKDHLTPVDRLAQKLYKKSTCTIKGSICKDTHFSHSRGSGTCAWHRGVLLKKDSISYHKSTEQCRQEAKEISWLPE